MKLVVRGNGLKRNFHNWNPGERSCGHAVNKLVWTDPSHGDIWYVNDQKHHYCGLILDSHEKEWEWFWLKVVKNEDVYGIAVNNCISTIPSDPFFDEHHGIELIKTHRPPECAWADEILDRKRDMIRGDKAL